MTWVDDDGVAHLVHQLPEEIWEKVNATSQTMFGRLAVMTDEEIRSGEVIILRSDATPHREYPRYQTYCGVPRYACADNPTPPTCMECLHIEGLIESLAARGIPWWR